MTMDRFAIPYLIPDQDYVLDYEFDAVVTGTPTAQLFVDGVADGPPEDGTPLGGNQWRFKITPAIDSVVGASARVRLTANVGGPVFVDCYSAIAATVNLIETDKSYRHTQDALDETNKTADVTVSEVT